MSAPTDRLPPVLMRRGEILTLKEAADETGRSERWLRKLVTEHAICRRVGGRGRMEISKIGLSMVLHDDLEALRLLRQNERNDERVLRYFILLGVPP